MQRAGRLLSSVPFPQSAIITTTLSTTIVDKPTRPMFNTAPGIPTFIIVQGQNLRMGKDSKRQSRLEVAGMLNVIFPTMKTPAIVL